MGSAPGRPTVLHGGGDKDLLQSEDPDGRLPGATTSKLCRSLPEDCTL